MVNNDQVESALDDIAYEIRKMESAELRDSLTDADIKGAIRDHLSRLQSEGDEIAALRSRLQDVEAAYRLAHHLLYKIPELNMINYTDDEVYVVNRGVSQLYEIMDGFLRSNF